MSNSNSPSARMWRSLPSRTFFISLLFFVCDAAIAEYAETSSWQNALDASQTWTVNQTTLENQQGSAQLKTINAFGDSIIRLKYESIAGSDAKLLLLGRYAYELNFDVAKEKTDKPHEIEVWFRAARLTDALTKVEDAAIVKVLFDNKEILTNKLFPGTSPNAFFDWEHPIGKHYLLTGKSKLRVFSMVVIRADFSAVEISKDKTGKSNLGELVDSVALGKQYFTDFGCAECHSVTPNDSAVKSGPNLYSLFKLLPQEREIVEGGEKHKFSVKADNQYLLTSVRNPQYQLAIGRSGLNQGKAFAPVMPAYSQEIIPNNQIIAIGDYLRTLNQPADQGPVYKLDPASGPLEYNPLQDKYLYLVGDRTRIQRGPMIGMSARAIHVGLVNGVNYSFDPRNLSVVKIWQGGFLNMSGELRHRGGKGLEPGFEAREIHFGDADYLLAPLASDGKLIDSGFKNAKFRDYAVIVDSLNSKRDFSEMQSELDAQFLGYRLDSLQKDALPQFSYLVGKNNVAVSFNLNDKGRAEFKVVGKFETAQKFKLNINLLHAIDVDRGVVEKNIWTIPTGTTSATLSSRIDITETPWKSAAPKFNDLSQKLETSKGDNETLLPLGYAIENFRSPKDNFGREQLFEAMGLAQAKDGTIVVATRTSGIWRLKDNKWWRFAEGTFDSLGLVIEDDKGLVLTVGQKPELTRIADTNGDGVADSYRTLFDTFSYHGNYHTYLHGPIKTLDGKYFITLNLAHDDAAYRAGGKYMGTYGGYSGWALLVDEDGSFQRLASGLRSPAGLGMGPDGRLWYTDNQGEYLGTSKLFNVQEHAFYAHPAGLIDKPGVQPGSSKIAWDKVKDKRTPATLLFPHNRLANSPGHIVWDTTDGKFGLFGNQVFVGDQTQSTLMRIILEKTQDTEQGAIIPFAAELASGVMRPLFLQDGSLLLGQTGRGWRPRGGEVASLQRISWDGTTIPEEILSVNIQANGFKVSFTNKISNIDESAIELVSWRYRDAPDYGSPELDLRKEEILSLKISDEGKAVFIELAKQKEPLVHPEQTSRIYHIRFKREKLFSEGDKRALEAYYTVNKRP